MLTVRSKKFVNAPRFFCKAPLTLLYESRSVFFPTIFYLSHKLNASSLYILSFFPHFARFFQNYFLLHNRCQKLSFLMTCSCSAVAACSSGAGNCGGIRCIRSVIQASFFSTSRLNLSISSFWSCISSQKWL